MKNDHKTLRRTLSLLLALVLLIGVLPELTLPVHALGGYSERSVDGFDYCIYWSDDTWGEGTVGFHCPYCNEDFGRDFDEGDDPDDIVLDMIAENLCEDCDHCLCCAPELHCHICHKCFDNGDAVSCPYCNSMYCLDCHLDTYFCDICGNCRLEDGADGEHLTGAQVELPNCGVLCGDCFNDIEECVECSNIISIGESYKTYEEMGADWCETCGLCHDCATNRFIAADYGHCSICGVCGYEQDVCEDCHRCDSCAHVFTHCPMCNLCFPDGVEWCTGLGLHCVECDEEHNWICEQCEGCRFEDGTSLCEDCGLCSDCCLQNSEDDGCIHGLCIYSSSYEDHLCPACGLCPEDEQCEYCGMCASCQEDYHCKHEICPENDDEWEEHLCENCGDCFELDELCELCHLCEDCWEHCDHGICPEDPEYDDHICPQCYDCYDVSEFCDDCGLCINCCEENTEDLGCIHGICIESSEFQSHYCFADMQCRTYCDHSANCSHTNKSADWSMNETSHWHVCADCGSAVDCEAHLAGAVKVILAPNVMTGANGKGTVSCQLCGQLMELVTIPCIQIPKDGSPYVISQPKDYAGWVSDVNLVGEARYATFSVYAGGEGLSYQWYKRFRSQPAVKLRNGGDVYQQYSGREDVTGATSSTLIVAVDSDACYEDYVYYCVVTNAKGSVTTREAKLDAQHHYAWCLDNGDGTHSYYCIGDGCGDTRGQPTPHRYGDWELKQAATATQQGVREQKCMDCSAVNRDYIPRVDPDHVHSYSKLKYGPGKHWYECACGERKNEQAHTFGEWKTTILATVIEGGRREHTCTVCGYTEAELTEKLSHVHDFTTLKRNDPRNVANQRYILPNGYVEEEYHVRYCAKCTSKEFEPHRYGYWSLMHYPYTDSKGVYHQGIVSRFCQECGKPDSRYFDEGKWPVMIEVWNDETGVGTGGPAKVSGTRVAKAGDTVTVSAKAFDGYLLGDAQQGYGAWSFNEVTGYEGTEICGTWHAFKNNDIKNIKLNADGSISFTMPDGPVGLMVFPKKCDHSGASTHPDTIAATCTGYGSKVLVCEKCGGPAKTTDYIDPTGHDWKTLRLEEYGDCDRREVVYQECARCGGERYHKTAYVHEWTDLDEGVEPSCFRAGRDPDQKCRYCDEIRLGDRIPAYGSHSYGPWITTKAATNRTKGSRYRECSRCGFTQTEILDFTGADYRLVGNRSKIHFDFTYGETPEPVSVTFTSVGRTPISAITDVDERVLGNVTTQSIDGMTLTVGAVPYEMIGSMRDEVELLDVWEVDGLRLPDEDVPQIEVSANIRKTKEKYTLTVEGGVAYSSARSPKTAKSALSVQGGEELILEPERKRSDDFLRWELVSDKSGMIKARADSYMLWCDNPMTLYMSPNDVTVRAIYKNTPGVYQITFDPNGGSTGNTTSYTNSAGEIDYLPDVWRSNYVFDGWWTDPAAGTRVDVGSVLTQDTTLYAHWRERAGAESDPYPEIAFTKDSKAAVGRSLTVDIEAMAGKHSALMDAFLGDEISYQWFRDGKMIAGQNGVSFRITDGYEGAEVYAVVCFSGHQIIGDPVTVGGDGDVNPFADVKAGAYYYDAVLWAVDHDPQVTNGTDATHFSPDSTCTRGQVVTFLWRAAGCPESKSTAHPFTDLKPSAFYYKAVLWAVEQGITKGTSANTFGPDQGCTRGQVVTFLWRAAGSPGVEGGSNPFVDVKPGAFYEKAVAWAVAQNITKGTAADRFSPDATCTRGQIVTFLYRAEQAEQKLLLMYVENSFAITGRGKVLVGTVLRGKLRTGDELEIQGVGSDGKPAFFKATAKSVQLAGGPVVQNASVGDRIGIVIGAGYDEVQKGDAVVNAKGPYKPVTGGVVGTLELSGRKQPAFAGYHPFFHYGDSYVTAVLQDLNGEAMLQPKTAYENITFGELARPVTLYVGQTVELNDGGPVGTFTVTKLP